jgi:endoplasmic reticulum-Golgi intermediate compartment protein 3
LQCVQEGWSDKLKEQASEGCNIAGHVRINKVVGNIHLSPGRSFRTGSQNIYELVPYLKDDGNRHDFTHTIHQFSFFGDDEFSNTKSQYSKKLKAQLGIESNPLDGTTQRVRSFLAFRAITHRRYRVLSNSTCSNIS